MTWKRRSFLCAAAGMISGLKAQEHKLVNMTVVLGRVSLSFYAVTGAVVQEVLERLGHRVELIEGPHEQIFPLLGQDAIDLMAAAWLPEGHRTYWERFGPNSTEVATLYDGARFFWAVPNYVPQSDVRSIADLAKPGVARRMTKAIQGIGPGAAISRLTQQAISAYGLDASGYEFCPGTAAQWIAAHDVAVVEKRWIVFPTWAPQYLNKTGSLRPLGDPRGVLGGVNRASLVGPRARLAALPRATVRTLARIELGLDSVTQMDWFVNVDGRTPVEAARTWMRTNAVRVEAWFAD